jgi:hypothetical protein
MYKSYWKSEWYPFSSVLECYVRFRVFFCSIKINSLSLRLFKVGAEIVRKSLTYLLKLNAQNVDVSVRVITEMVQTQICSQVPVSQKFFTNSLSSTKFFYLIFFQMILLAFMVHYLAFKWLLSSPISWSNQDVYSAQCLVLLPILLSNQTGKCMLFSNSHTQLTLYAKKKRK